MAEEILGLARLLHASLSHANSMVDSWQERELKLQRLFVGFFFPSIFHRARFEFLAKEGVKTSEAEFDGFFFSIFRRACFLCLLVSHWCV